jgi:hypothetical protein
VIRAVELPLVFQLGRIRSEARQRCELAEEGLRISLIRADWRPGLRALRELPNNKIADFERRKMHADRNIKTFADYVDAAIGAFQQYVDVRTLLHEACDHLADLERNQRRWAAYAYDPRGSEDIRSIVSCAASASDIIATQ